MNKYLLAIALVVICGTSAKGNDEPTGAKALFHDEGNVSVRTSAEKSTPKKSTAPAKKKDASAPAESYLGVSYWIDLIDSTGKASRTTTSRVFQSGDRIKLNVQSNTNGFLYVVGVGSSGTSRVLFPNSPEVANGIKAKVTYAVPFNNMMKFDDTPGEEQLMVLLSDQPLPQFAAGQKTLPAKETNQMVAASYNGSKDLVLEDDDSSSNAVPASYAVMPVSKSGEKAPLSLLIKLKHK